MRVHNIAGKVKMYWDGIHFIELAGKVCITSPISHTQIRVTKRE